MIEHWERDGVVCGGVGAVDWHLSGDLALSTTHECDHSGCGVDGAHVAIGAGEHNRRMVAG